MTKKFIPTALAAAMLLAGCSLIPTYERPAAPVPTTFPGDPAQPAGQAAAALPWQDFFTDPRLAGLIQTALANNRDLRVSVLNIEQARAQFQIERSALFPALGLTGSGSRSSPNQLQAFDSSAGSVSSQYSVNLGITAWEIDFFGRIRSLKDQALAQYLATEETRKAAQISLIAAVATGWLTLIADDELLELTRQTMVTREESVRLTKLRFDNGVSSELDFQAANSLAETARASYAQQLRTRQQDENALALLLGAPVPAEATAGGARGLDGIKPMPEVPAGLPSDLLAERPDIRSAEQQLIAANANIGAARAAFFPRVSLTTSIGTASSEFSGLFDSGSKAWAFAPQITLPIFDAGRNIAGLDSAKAGREIAVAQYEKSIQTAFREVADALAGRATLGEQVRAQRAQADAEAVRFKLSDMRYRNGIASALDLLDAQRSLYTAQQSAVTTRLLQLQNQVTLYKTLGGGWTGRENKG
ncbi:efflux transporter outer membrane subunit [Variovorax paradoxus]|uniref:efflux transporter outer membrane subunit n=1 Tax=Variovorax paradoxus TaxID=34073 RepID=UPI0024810037|nr:efflux transporter outer membrane subunit [Variovorax paradoxus]WGT61750.1 efflux transporter outer membrane subunit [Variovorax paradoxus]WGT61795.1 efflux transporter outer membrane subunit [Variovorax paradoxus]